MKVIFALAILSASAFAEPNGVPAYYGKLEGVIATGLTQRQALTFQPGTIEKCERKEIASVMTTFNCEVKGASVQVAGASPINVAFNKLFVFYKVQKGGDVVQEYILNGTYEDKSTKPALKSRLHLTLWNYASAPTGIRGSINLVDLGVLGGIQATPAN